MTTQPLTGRMHADGTPVSLAEYRDAGGYAAMEETFGHLSAEDLQAVVKGANLRGRGGAGFPTGVKWSFVPADESTQPHYLVANADEMEPGTFKDRLLMENDPHQLLEGMALAAYAIRAHTAYIFLRGEYFLAAERLRAAIAEARAAGLLGRDVLKSGYDLDIHLHTSAGRYICGEETALLNALEGKRATPRAKPPFPQVSGAWGQPTVVNNVETLCNIPHIVRLGAEWYAGVSNSKDGGTKLYGASGKVRRAGCWELPMGTTAREIVEEHAGGMRDGYRLRGWLPGGASTDFLLEEHLDLAMDYDTIGKAGSRMGTGNLIILDDQTCPVKMVRNLEHFFARESCGWCTPCRDGLSWVEILLDDLIEGRGRPEDLQVLEEHTRRLGPGNTFCAHAPGAMEPLQSALKYFRDDFLKYLGDQPGVIPMLHERVV